MTSPEPGSEPCRPSPSAGRSRGHVLPLCSCPRLHVGHGPRPGDAHFRRRDELPHLSQPANRGHLHPQHLGDLFDGHERGPASRAARRASGAGAPVPVRPRPSDRASAARGASPALPGRGRCPPRACPTILGVKSGHVELHAATADRFPDLVAILAPKKAQTPACWCLSYRLSGRENSALTPSERPERLRRFCVEDPPPGVLAYVDDVPAGWCSVAPRGSYHRLVASRTIPKLDDVPVWSITCFVVRSRLPTARLSPPPA
jgi:hypothetical protein